MCRQCLRPSHQSSVLTGVVVVAGKTSSPATTSSKDMANSNGTVRTKANSKVMISIKVMVRRKAPGPEQRHTFLLRLGPFQLFYHSE
jgi:hypothetical protein